MRAVYKRLKGKEMSAPDGNGMTQIQCVEWDSGGEEIEKEGRNWLRVGGGRVRDGIELPVMEIEGLRFSAVEGAGATAAEDGQLIARLVDGTIAVDAL